MELQSQGWATRPKGLLRDYFANFGKSHCAEVFAKAIPGFSLSAFKSKALSTNYYNVREQPCADWTQNDVTGNGDSTTLNLSLAYGDDARTINGGLGHQTAVLLGAGFFTDPTLNPTAALVHEDLHAYFNWSDPEIFAHFAAYGLKDTSGGYNTADISEWIEKDCPEDYP